MNRLKRETGRSDFDLKRLPGILPQRKLICICAEGTVTERSYLESVEYVFKKELKNQDKEDDAKFSFVYATENKKTAPMYLLNKMKKKLESLTKKQVVSAWIISDKDGWLDNQLNEIKVWVNEESSKRNWILSNPRIEYWFELHFQKKSDYQSFEKRYNKKILNNDFTYDQIVDACEKARAKKQKIDDLYTQRGSLMYKIIEYIGKEYGLCSEDSRGRVDWK